MIFAREYTVSISCGPWAGLRQWMKMGRICWKIKTFTFIDDFLNFSYHFGKDTKPLQTKNVRKNKQSYLICNSPFSFFDVSLFNLLLFWKSAIKVKLALTELYQIVTWKYTGNEQGAVQYIQYIPEGLSRKLTGTLQPGGGGSWIPIRYGFRARAIAIRNSMNTYPICDAPL